MHDPRLRSFPVALISVELSLLPGAESFSSSTCADSDFVSPSFFFFNHFDIGNNKRREIFTRGRNSKLWPPNVCCVMENLASECHSPPGLHPSAFRRWCGKPNTHFKSSVLALQLNAVRCATGGARALQLSVRAKQKELQDKESRYQEEYQKDEFVGTSRVSSLSLLSGFTPPPSRSNSKSRHETTKAMPTTKVVAYPESTSTQAATIDTLLKNRAFPFALTRYVFLLFCMNLEIDYA